MGAAESSDAASEASVNLPSPDANASLALQQRQLLQLQQQLLQQQQRQLDELQKQSGKSVALPSLNHTERIKNDTERRKKGKPALPQLKTKENSVVGDKPRSPLHNSRSSAGTTSAAGQSVSHPPTPDKVSASPQATDLTPRPRLTRAGTLVRGIAVRPADKKKLFYSLLVHTVSHADMLVSFRSVDGVDCIGKPRFSHFLPVSEMILDHIRGYRPHADVSAASVAAEEERLRAAAVYLARKGSPGVKDQPVGYSFDDRPLRMKHKNAWDMVKLKGTEYKRDFGEPDIYGVYFPILSVILPIWLRRCDELRRGRSGPGLRWLYLVSGSGTPWNHDHSATGNSTEGVALLLAEFVRIFFPEIKVILVHSGTEIFHYDENVQFVNNTLKPLIENVRRDLAESVYEKWAERMNLTLSLSAGAPARVSAITAALREFHPNSLHMWQLKTLWHSFPNQKLLNESDVEYHSFEKLETTPAVAVGMQSQAVQLLVREMRSHKEAFEAVRDGERYHELDKFWLRKSKKPVLCVLMTQKKGSLTPIFFRGINSEVSLPTGSLCAERNAVSSALASDLTLVRQDLKMVAVLAVPLTTDVVSDSPAGGRGHLTGSSGRLPAVSEQKAAMDDYDDDGGDSNGTALFPNDEADEEASAVAAARSAAMLSRPEESNGDTQHEQDSRNPIAPCGACNEWLRKIFEVNPDFKIVTFPDLSLDRAFVKGVM